MDIGKFTMTRTHLGPIELGIPVAFATVLTDGKPKAVIRIEDPGGEWWRILVVTEFVDNNLVSEQTCQFSTPVEELRLPPRAYSGGGHLEGNSYGVDTDGNIIPSVLHRGKVPGVFCLSIEPHSLLKEYVYRDVANPGRMTEALANAIVKRFFAMDWSKRFSCNIELV